MSDLSASPLVTDLYQLTMLQAYFDEGLSETAVFEFFVRRLPPERNFLLAAGLESLLDYLAGLRFQSDELEWLASTGRFQPGFVDWLAQLRFTGDVHALPEGTVFFAEQPIVRITAPLSEAQLVESRLINLLHYQTLVASKAARCVLAAGGRKLIDFGMRRAHGAEAALLAARATYLAGFDGTATVEAGRRWQIPIYGTMAHAYIQAHDDEATAFQRYVAANPKDVVLLIDTYDPMAAAAKIVALAPRWQAQGIHIRALRIDSGDLGEMARGVRQILDAGQLHNVAILASGNLDELSIAELVVSAAPIDSFGVGTRLDVSVDCPYLDCAYKLQEYAGRPRRKRSAGKATWPGRKQIFREFDAQGRMLLDHLALENEAASGEPLLLPVMRGGQRLAPAETWDQLRARSSNALASLPERLRGLHGASEPYEVRFTDGVRALAAQFDRQVRG